MLISVVVPVYDSARSLEELVEGIGRVFEDRPECYEIIFVDDHSPRAESWQTLERLALEHPEVCSIQLTRNFGQQAATLCGLRESRGDFVVTMDDDLQHDPIDIPRFLERCDSDIVIGQFQRKRHSFLQRLTSRIKSVFDRIILGKPSHIQLSSYRMLSRTIVDGMLSIHTPNPFIPAMMFHVSKNVVGVDVSHQTRVEGDSGYTFFKRFRLFSNLIVNNSSLVLRLVGQTGMIFALFSILIGFWVIFKKLAFGVAIQGWASLFSTQLFIGGLLLFSVGVVGEYLIRIIESTEERPTYFVRRRIT